MKLERSHKNHPRNRCTICGALNCIPDKRYIDPENAGARWGLNLNVSVHGPGLWKAAGGPGAMTAVGRLCHTCSGVVLDALAALGLLAKLTEKEQHAFALMRVPPKS